MLMMTSLLKGLQVIEPQGSEAERNTVSLYSTIIRE
jgi:hypothetical protein